MLSGWLCTVEELMCLLIAGIIYLFNIRIVHEVQDRQGQKHSTQYR